MNPNRVTTRTGITIGARYTMPPPRDIGSQAEAIQAALLRRSNVIAFHGAMKPRRSLPTVIRTRTPWWLRVLHFFNFKGSNR